MLLLLMMIVSFFSSSCIFLSLLFPYTGNRRCRIIRTNVLRFQDYIRINVLRFQDYQRPPPCIV